MPEIAEREPKVISVVLRHVGCVPWGALVCSGTAHRPRRPEDSLRSGWRGG